MTYLDRNEFNFAPSPKVVEAVENFDPGLLCFYTRMHEESKKSQLSVRLSEISGVPENQIVLGYGCEDIIKSVVHYYLGAGTNRKVMIPDYSWWYYDHVVGECAGEIIRYPLGEKGDSYFYNVDELVRLAKARHPKILLLASPNNPTGNSLGMEETVKVMDGVDRDTIVCIDEAYVSNVSSCARSTAQLVNQYDNLVVMRTFSKFYGLPGLRVGYGFTSGNNAGFLNYINKYLGYNRFSEAVALAALDSEDYYLEVAAQMDVGRKLLKNTLGSLAGFTVFKSDANFVLVKYPSEIRDGLRRALADRQCRIKFMADKGLESCLRITLGRPQQVQTVCDAIVEQYMKAKAS